MTRVRAWGTTNSRGFSGARQWRQMSKIKPKRSMGAVSPPHVGQLSLVPRALDSTLGAQPTERLRAQCFGHFKLIRCAPCEHAKKICGMLCGCQRGEFRLKSRLRCLRHGLLARRCLLSQAGRCGVVVGLHGLNAASSALVQAAEVVYPLQGPDQSWKS